MSEPLTFKISSELKNIIGKELITDDFIAIFELVKNSYDANAKKVEIVFFNTKKQNQTRIFIRDDGIGMSYDDLQNKWLLVAHSDKKMQIEENQDQDYRDKIQGRRVFAGAKGIGRFSCDKLGRDLHLYTKQEKDPIIHVLHMDWDKFEKDPLEQFQTISVPYRSYTKLSLDIPTIDFKKGTILEISSLRSLWDRKKLLQLKNYLQRLINPNQIGQVQEFKIYLRADEYSKTDQRFLAKKQSYRVINGLISNVLFESLAIKTTHVDVCVDETGEKITTELNDKDEFVYEIEEKNTFKPLKNIHVKLFYMNQAAKASFRREMGIHVVRYGSIFLYKNGIKINPYGNEGNDWLGLDRRKTQGVRRYLGNRDVIGRIEISGITPYFVEVSSRDGGLMQTTELSLLMSFFKEKALERLEKYVVQGINWDSENKPKNSDEAKADAFKIVSELAGKTDDETVKIKFNDTLLEKYAEKQLERTPELIKNIEAIKDIVTGQEERAYIDLTVKTVRNAFKNLVDTQKELEKELKQIEKEAIFIKEKAGEEKKELQALQHQIGIWADKIKDYLKILTEKMENDEPISRETLIEVIDNIMMRIKMMSSITSFVTKANFDLEVTKIERDLTQYISDYVQNIYIPIQEESGETVLAITVDRDPQNKFNYAFNPYEFIIIVDNLISNSVKAKAKSLKIKMNLLNENELEIRFKDDGIGIPDKDLPHLFNFGFSSRDGAGIGLYHIKKILDGIHGSIEVNNHVENGVEFKIKVIR